MGSNTTAATPDILALSETYTYNTLNRLTHVSVDFGAFSKSYRYTYYPNGLKHTYTNPEGVVYTYYYNKNNQIQAVHIPGKGQLAWTNFKWLAPQTIVLPGGNQITLSYDDFLRVKERILKDPVNDNIAQALYQYDLESNISKIGTDHGDYSFGYDNLYRLNRVDYPSSAAITNETFDYDGVGNRTGQSQSTDTTDSSATDTYTQSYNHDNQLTTTEITAGPHSGDSISYTYNANGHTKTKTHIKGGVTQTTEYIYNHSERLIAVKIDGNLVSENSYNPYGQRVKKTSAGNTTWYLYNGEGLAAEYSNDGTLIKEYQFTPYSPWMTKPLFQRTASGDVYYYQNDHLGTPQRLIARNGATVWEARYNAFGEADIIVNTVENNLRFPGQYYDQATQLHHNYFRDYDPSVGRYVQSDPIGLAGGINVYGYVYQNSLKYYDPTGEAAFVPVAICAANPACVAAVTVATEAIINLTAMVAIVLSIGNESSEEVGDNDVCEFDPAAGTKRKHPTDGDSGYEDEDGFMWEKDKAGDRAHGGSAWKRWKNKRKWEKDRKKPKKGRDGTYDIDGKRLGD